MTASDPRALVIDTPAWALAMGRQHTHYPTDDDRMALVIALARENTERREGGPFGAAVFEEATGRLVAVGVNSVRRLANCTLHAEMTALMFAGQAEGCHSLHREDGVHYMLATSCDPCAMCLGAILWSGVRRVVCAATRDDAMNVGFDEGPVFDDSWRYLAERGVTVHHGVQREQAREVLARYTSLGGMLYNG
ncbi:MAG TPA: nucleoside deaminase [Gemmatimonas sp.]|nr:nucleoside deaminase [Gemmatimonas sp.]